MARCTLKRRGKAIKRGGRYGSGKMLVSEEASKITEDLEGIGIKAGHAQDTRQWKNS